MPNDQGFTIGTLDGGSISVMGDPQLVMGKPQLVIVDPNKTLLVLNRDGVRIERDATSFKISVDGYPEDWHKSVRSLVAEWISWRQKEKAVPAICRTVQKIEVHHDLSLIHI